MTSQITVGSNKGIYTVEKTKEDYERKYAELEYIREYDGTNVLYFADLNYQIHETEASVFLTKP